MGYEPFKVGVTEYGGVMNGDGLADDGADNEPGAVTFAGGFAEVKLAGAGGQSEWHELAVGMPVQDAGVEPPSANKGARMSTHVSGLTLMVAPVGPEVSTLVAINTAT